MSADKSIHYYLMNTGNKVGSHSLKASFYLLLLSMYSGPRIAKGKSKIYHLIIDIITLFYINIIEAFIFVIRW